MLLDLKNCYKLLFFKETESCWNQWKANGRMSVILSYFIGGFCDLFESHCKGKDKFSWFLAAWYNFVGAIARENLANPKSNLTWQTFCSGDTVEVLDSQSRSALLFSMAKASYTFLRKQVKYILSAYN